MTDTPTLDTVFSDLTRLAVQFHARAVPMWRAAKAAHPASALYAAADIVPKMLNRLD